LDRKHRLFWSGQILPYIEQSSTRNSIDLNQPWDSYEPNVNAIRATLSIFRCPSSAGPSAWAQVIDGRGTCTYLGCASGTVGRESGTEPLLDSGEQSGVFYTNSHVQDRDFFDGLTYTMLIGESLFQTGVSGPDNYGVVQVVDHWYIGSPGTFSNEVSEALGSTAVPINAWRINPQPFIEDIELSFSSRHAGLIQCVFADGHIQSIADSVSTAVWRAVGTRAGSDIVSFDD